LSSLRGAIEGDAALNLVLLAAVVILAYFGMLLIARWVDS
jgi:hypothetical protein